MLKVRQDTRRVIFPAYSICRLHYVACVCSSLWYGWTKVDAQCLQGKAKVRDITCHWRYRVKYRYRATHFQYRTYENFRVSVQHQNRPFSHKNVTKYPILKTDGWSSVSFRTGVQKRKRLTTTGVLTPKRPFRSESLTRKQKSFYPVWYTHRPTALGVVSRH